MRTLGPLLIAGMVAGWSPPLWAGVSEPAPTPAEPEPEHADDQTNELPRTEIPRAILRADGVSFTELRDALAPRLPRTELLPFDDAAFEAVGTEPFAYVEVVLEPGPDAEVALTIVLSDQRAYLRRFAPQKERPLRSIVTTIANTLAAIEEERIEADEEAIEVPRPEPAEPANATEPESPEELESPPEPEPPEEIVEPLPDPTPPPYELGITTAIVPTVGLAPTTVRRLAATGGEVRVGTRFRRGTRVELGLRVSSRAREGHRLWRNRLSLTGGYDWRRERFGLTAVAGPTVEPWAVRLDGTPAELSAVSGARATPLWGGLVAVTPALRWQPTARLGLSLGLRTELSASVLGSGAAARVLLPDPQERNTAMLTLGGVELSAALELTLWLAPPATVPPTRARRPRSTPRWSRSDPR